MLQINERILVLSPGDQIPQVSGDSIKLYLAGTTDFGSAENDWQGKFIDGLVKLSDPLKGLLLIKNVNWIIFNPKALPTNDMGPSLENPEFVNNIRWRLMAQDQADMIFLNILKKSVSPIPVLEFGSMVTSGKLVVRCSEEYQIYPQIRLYCEKFQVPLLTGKTSVKDVILSGGNYIQKFRDLQQYNLPE